MSLDFIFSTKIDNTSLLQGDILQKTPLLKEAVAKAHRYYADAEDYHFYMVLTQSCDLVKRGGRKPRARYITIAAVRPLDVVVERQITKFAEPISGFPILVYKKENELGVKNYLERLLHNTQEKDGLFFIRRGSHPAFTEDYCVFLYLSIALRIDHYETCLAAKVAQLDNVFQAKVGWLTGNLYSRVGTPDVEDHQQNPEQYKKEFYEQVLSERTVWLSSEQRQQLKQALKTNNPSNEQEAREMIAVLKTDMDYLAERIVKKLVDAKIIAAEDTTVEAAKNILANDKLFKKLMTQVTQD